MINVFACYTDIYYGILIEIREIRHTKLSNYRPTSATPIMSRLAEKIFVQQ